MGGFFSVITIDFRKNEKKEQSKMNDFLRDECKYLKAFQNVRYKEIAGYLEIKADSFYSWLKGYYDFGAEKQKRLEEIISNLREK